ncbi:MAG: hypothetical protein HYT72_02395 [Candidatus Aenigmarchaeota archaeon]|nr:hypothetical protein [Candidatus Aenigmarchaeota archaeon]
MKMKGMFFSVIVLLLSLTLLGFTFLLFRSNFESSASVLRMGVTDRIIDEIKSYENGLHTILDKAVNVRTTSNAVVFIEDLPNSNAKSFPENINSFKNFAEARSDFFLRLNIAPNLGLRMMPSQAIYYHPRGFGNETIEVTNASTVARYSINITINRTGATPVSWNTTNEDPNGIAFDVTVGGLTGTDFTDSKNLSRTSASRLSIKVPGGNIEIYIGGSENSRLVINNTNSIVAFVKTSVFFSQSSNYVTLNDQSINITAGEYNISRIDAVRVA